MRSYASVLGRVSFLKHSTLRVLEHTHSAAADLMWEKCGIAGASAMLDVRSVIRCAWWVGDWSQW